MIGTISIECNAKNPNMPLHPLRAYVGSPSSLRIINVPKKIGNWQIKSVTLTAVYPDSSVQTASCVLVGGVWVGTIAGCSTAGSNQNGYTIYASGVDENGLDVEGYVLGKGDVVVLEANGEIPENAIAQLSAEVQNKRDYDDMCIPAQPSDTTPIWFGDIECDWDAESESWKSADGLVEISRVGSSDKYEVTAYSQLIPEEVVWIKARVTLALPTYKAYVKAGGTSPDILIRSFDGSIATESYVDEVISNISATLDLSAYATTEYVDGIADGKADVSSLNDYYTKNETSSSIEIQDALDGKADVSSLNDYYTKNETSSATQLETAFSNISVDMSDYYTKNETSSAVEIQGALDGKQPTGDYALASQIPTNVSQLSNDAGYLTEHQSLSDYYTKNETSSNVEIDAKFETKADISAIPTKTSELSNDSGFITSADIITKRDLSNMTVKGVPQNTNSQSWFSIKYGTTTENAWYYDEGRWESGNTLRVLAAPATIYTLQKNQGGQWTNIGEFQLDNNAEATITYDGVTYSITGYVGEIVVSNQLISQIAALEARIAALEGN